MTSRLKRVALLFACLGLAPATQVLAGSRPGQAFIPMGDVADAPSGFIELCERDEVLCAAGVEAAPAPREESGRGEWVSVSFDSLDVTPEAPALDAGCLFLSRLSAYLTSLEPALAAPSVVALRTAWTGAASNVLDARCSTPLAQRAAISSAALLRPVAPVLALPRSARGFGLGQGADKPRPVPAVLTASDSLSLLKKVNSHVNRGVRQVSDFDMIGVDERWDRPGVGSKATGDCEDLAIEKRMQLLEAGVRPDALFYGTVYKRGFGLHVVLVARTDKGDMVLDSLTPHVLPWNKTKYSWLRVQSTEDPKEWRRVGSPKTSLPVFTAQASPSAQDNS